MKKEDIELRSPKVQNVIGRMPRGVVVVTIIVYVIVLAIILTVFDILDIDGAGVFLKRFLGK